MRQRRFFLSASVATATATTAPVATPTPTALAVAVATVVLPSAVAENERRSPGRTSVTARAAAAALIARE